MYRQVCLFLALLLALSAGMVRATLDLRAQQDQVTFTETRAYVSAEALQNQNRPPFLRLARALQRRKFAR